MFESYLGRWSLTPDGEPIITHSSRLLPVLWNGKPAMLKLSRDGAERAGGALMHWWHGDGAAKVYAHDEEAVLLERATGGRSLLKMAMDGEDDEASRIICHTVERLHAPRKKPLPDLIPLRRWFRELEPVAKAYGGTLAECSVIAEQLLSDPRDPVVLHGDIHHSNILDFEEDGWLAIDPKGLIGERSFDYANIFAERRPSGNQRAGPAAASTADRMRRGRNGAQTPAEMDRRLFRAVGCLVPGRQYVHPRRKPPRRRSHRTRGIAARLTGCLDTGE